MGVECASIERKVTLTYQSLSLFALFKLTKLFEINIFILNLNLCLLIIKFQTELLNFTSFYQKIYTKF